MSEKNTKKLPLFAEALKKLRSDKNWSLRDCEKRTGGNISRQTFLRAEQGDVTLEQLIKILDLYGAKKREEVVRSFMDHELAKARAAA